MKVSDIMTKGIEGIQSSDSVHHAAVRMKELDIGSLAVFSGDDPVGMITDRDITVRVIGASLNPLHTSVGEVMTKDPQVCDEEADVRDAVQIMENHKIRRLLVRNKKGQISGVLSVDDIALRGDERLVADVIGAAKHQHSREPVASVR